MDKIIEMVVEEIKRRDKGNPYSTLIGVLEEINEEVTDIFVEAETGERRREHD